jgi:hypothetical protein
MAGRLTLSRALKQGGIGRDAAEHIATEIFDAIHENVAKKTDLRTTETSLRTALQTTETPLRTDLKASEAAFRADLALVEHRLLTRMGSMIIAATGILVAIHYTH